MTTGNDTAVRDDIAALIAEVFAYRGPLTLAMVRDDPPDLYMDSATYTKYAAELYAEEGKYIRELGVKLD